MRKVIYNLCFPVFLLMSLSVSAQRPDDEILQTVHQLYDVYDSVRMLSFDCRYTYTSDTVQGDYQDSQLEASCTLDSGRQRFRLGDIEYVRNDSMFVALYERQKLIVVSNQMPATMIPMRTSLDSLLATYTDHYRLSEDSIGAGLLRIRFDRRDTLAPFTHFFIDYNPMEMHIQSVSYEFLTEGKLFHDSLDLYGPRPSNEYIPPRHQRLQIDFFNYRLENFTSDPFSERNYIWFDGEEWQPVERYRDFRVFNSTAR